MGPQGAAEARARVGVCAWVDDGWIHGGHHSARVYLFIQKRQRQIIPIGGPESAVLQ